MPGLTRRAGPIGLALTAYDLWRKLPKERQRQVLQQVKKNGPKVASTAVRIARSRLRAP